MRNQFKGTCIRCGKEVPIGAGLLSFIGHDEKKMWPTYRFQKNVSMIQHDGCAALYTGTDTHWQFNPIEDLSK